MKIYVDAGHNGSSFDTGAQGNGLLEQDINFQVAQLLCEGLKAHGIDVKASRNKITDNLGSNLQTSLAARYNGANEWGADYFISIHCNAFSENQANGTETYHYPSSQKGQALAKEVQGWLINDLCTTDRGVKSRPDLAVLNKTRMPAILVECAFITNPSDANILANRQRDISVAILKGVLSHLNISMIKSITDKKNFTIKTVGSTQVIAIQPLVLKAEIVNAAATSVNRQNFVNGGYFMMQANGIPFYQGILVSEGKILSNNQPHGKACGTMIVKKDGNVMCKPCLDITRETDVWFAISGCSILPEIRMAKEGFVDKFADIARETKRPVMGFNPRENMIYICVRKESGIYQGQLTLRNVGCSMGITLDGGGSTALRVGGEYYYKGDGRILPAVVYWE